MNPIKNCARECICLGFLLIAVSAQGTESPTKLEQMVVSASRTEQRLGDTPRPTYLITRDEIEARQPENIQVLLREIPGVQVVERTGSWGGGGSIQLMGLDAAHTLVLVDGQRFIGGNDVVDIASLPVEAIERIEVVKGPGSSLYGSEAIGGVVQIFTRRAGEGRTLRAGVAAGSRNRARLHAGGAFGAERTGIRMDYTHREDDGILRPKDESRWDTLSATLHHAPTEKTELLFTPLFTRQVNTDDSQKKAGKTVIQERIQERAGLNASATFSPDALTRIQTRASYIGHDHSREDGTLHQFAQSHEFEAGFSRTFSRHTFSAGYAYFGEKIEDKATEVPASQKTHSIPGDTADQQTHSLHVQDELDLGRSTLTLGGRASHHEDWGADFSPQAGIVFRAKDTLSLRASVGRAFAAPSLLKLYAEMPKKKRTILVKPNPDLDPETAISWQAGFDWEATPRFLLRASVFRNDIENLITTVPHASGGIYQTYANIGEAMTQGVEWSASFRAMEDFKIILSHSYTETENKKTGKSLLERPEHRASLDLDYRLPHPDLRLRLTGSWTGEREYTAEDSRPRTRLSAYTTLDLALTWQVHPHLALFSRIENLTHEKDVADEWRLDGTEWMAGMKLDL